MDFIQYLMPIAALLLTALEVYRQPKRLSKYALAIAFCVFYAIIVMLAAGAPADQALFVMGTAVVAVNMLYAYSSHKLDFLLGLIVTILGFAYWSMQPLNIMPFIQAFAVGSLLAVVLKLGYSQKVSRSDKRLEKRRDILQIAMGAVVLAVFFLLQGYAYQIVFLLALFGYAASTLLLDHRLARPLKGLERTGSAFGAGAIYMAVGTMLILGSVPNYYYAIVALSALLICDAVATIVGIHGTHKLPYNREKTMEGTLAYFVVLVAIGFPLISYYSIIFAAVLAALESVIQSVDDNIAIPIAAIVLYYVI